MNHFLIILPRNIIPSHQELLLFWNQILNLSTVQPTKRVVTFLSFFAIFPSKVYATCRSCRPGPTTAPLRPAAQSKLKYSRMLIMYNLRIIPLPPLQIALLLFWTRILGLPLPRHVPLLLLLIPIPLFSWHARVSSR
jgi:hypothetical protein